MEIDGLQLENTTKLERAKTNLQAKLGEDVSNSDILVEYDRLGGLLTRGGQKIKTGCFYDAKNKKAFPEPKIIFIYTVNGHIVEVPDGAELPGEVRAANILADMQKEDSAKTTKPKSTKKAGMKTEGETGESAEAAEDE